LSAANAALFFYALLRNNKKIPLYVVCW